MLAHPSVVRNLSCTFESLGKLDKLLMPFLHPRASDLIGLEAGLSIRNVESSQMILLCSEGRGPVFCIILLPAGNHHGNRLLHPSWTLQIGYSKRTTFSKHGFIIGEHLQTLSQNLIFKRHFAINSMWEYWYMLLNMKEKLANLPRNRGRAAKHSMLWSAGKRFPHRVAVNTTRAAHGGLVSEYLWVTPRDFWKYVERRCF